MKLFLFFTLAWLAFSPVELLAQMRRNRPNSPASREETPLTPNSPSAPTGIEISNTNLPQGKLTPFEFSTASSAHQAILYTPPNYDSKQRYPVLYLLHGASGNERTWADEIGVAAILDRLIAEKKAVPMLVVMPSSRSKEETSNNSSRNARPANPQAAMAFTNTLVDDLMPFIEKKLPVRTEREARAVAGLSMGGGLAPHLGISHAERFGFVGAFSGVGRRWNAPQPPLKLLWLSVGSDDTLVRQSVLEARDALIAAQVPLIFKIHEGGHEPKTWRSDFYHFAQLLFKNS